MAKHVTRWSPDTCSCTIEYEWDDTEPAETRQHNLSNYVNRCPEHSVLPDNNAAYTGVKEENTRKNIAYQGIIDNGPAALYDLQQDGSKTLKNNITFNWTWSGTPPNRVMTLSYSGITLTQQQKNVAQTWLNNKFGTGKVVLA